MDKSIRENKNLKTHWVITIRTRAERLAGVKDRNFYVRAVTEDRAVEWASADAEAQGYLLIKVVRVKSFATKEETREVMKRVILKTSP